MTDIGKRARLLRLNYVFLAWGLLIRSSYRMQLHKATYSGWKGRGTRGEAVGKRSSRTAGLERSNVQYALIGWQVDSSSMRA